LVFKKIHLIDHVVLAHDNCCAKLCLLHSFQLHMQSKTHMPKDIKGKREKETPTKALELQWANIHGLSWSSGGKETRNWTTNSRMGEYIHLCNMIKLRSRSKQCYWFQNILLP